MRRRIWRTCPAAVPSGRSSAGNCSAGWGRADGICRRDGRELHGAVPGCAEAGRLLDLQVFQDDRAAGDGERPLEGGPAADRGVFLVESSLDADGFA